MASILVVDDQRNVRTTLAVLLRASGHDVREAESGEAGLEAIRASLPDVVITDLRLGGLDGIELLKRAKEIAPLAEVIVMTAYGTIESAVEAMRLGACDYLQKPFREDELLVRVARALERNELVRAVSWFATEFRERYHIDSIIGRSPAMREVLSRVIRVAPAEATVLITGESGTGKELIARALHANSSRASHPFVSVNCAAIADSLLESELFGHAKGAFTGAFSSRRGLFEEANGGTFFLDEIGELPLGLQAKILRALQEREIRRVGENKPIRVDVRIIAATHQDLQRAIQEKRFREDLYYRLNVARISLPALRDRTEDIPLLAEFFLKRANQKMKRTARFEDRVFDGLMDYAFPGNIRELENMIEQAVVLAEDGIVRLDDLLPPDSSRYLQVPSSSRPAPARSTGDLASVVDDVERATIEEMLRQTGGNRELAAQKLGLSVTTLWRKMKRLKISWRP